MDSTYANDVSRISDYNLGQDKMEQQPPLPPPSVKIKDEAARRPKYAILLTLIWEGSKFFLYFVQDCSFVGEIELFRSIAGGGGGGVDKMKGDSPRCHGSSSNNGNGGYGGSQFQGGSGGKGAEEGDNNYSGGGGGGFETNGRSNQNFGGAKGTGGEGGKSFYKGNLIT